MIHRPYKKTTRALLFVCALWMLGACSQATTRSRPEPIERPPKLQAPAAVPLEVPAGPETPAPVPPAMPAGAETPAPVPPQAPVGIEEASVPVAPEVRPKAMPPVPLTPEAPARAKPSPVKPEPRFHVHVVQWQGETLSLIAQWYTLSRLNWEAIAAANPGIDPKRIEIGSRVRIPEGLLKRREPMPFDLFHSSSASKRIAPPSPARTAPEKRADKAVPEPAKASEKPGAVPEEVELFGPQEADARGAATAPEEVELFGPGEIAGRQGRVPEEAELFGPVE